MCSGHAKIAPVGSILATGSITQNTLFLHSFVPRGKIRRQQTTNAGNPPSPSRKIDHGSRHARRRPKRATSATAKAEEEEEEGTTSIALMWGIRTHGTVLGDGPHEPEPPHVSVVWDRREIVSGSRPR